MSFVCNSLSYIESLLSWVPPFRVNQLNTSSLLKRELSILLVILLLSSEHGIILSSLVLKCGGKKWTHNFIVKSSSGPEYKIISSCTLHTEVWSIQPEKHVMFVFQKCIFFSSLSLCPLWHSDTVLQNKYLVLYAHFVFVHFTLLPEHFTLTEFQYSSKCKFIFQDK